MTGFPRAQIDGILPFPYLAGIMFPLSRRALGILCITGFSLAGVGWFKALNKDDAGAVPGETGSAKNGKREDRNARDPGSKASLASDPRSVRLVELMEQLGEGTETGEPNSAFLKAAQLTLDDSLFQRRQRDFRMLLEKMSAEDAAEIHARFRAMEKEGRYFAPEYGAFAMRWGQLDGEGAMAIWMARELHDRPIHDMANVITGWATTDPEEALKWAEENKEALAGANPYPHLLAGWLTKDPVAATAWLANANLDAGQYRECVRAGVLDKIYSDGLDGASEWLASLPTTSDEQAQAARDGWNTHIGHLGHLEPELAAAAWSKVGSKPWMTSQEFAGFCRSVARGNGGSLEGFAEQLSQQWPKAEASSQFSQWTEQDPNLVRALLSELPPSEIRSTGIEGMLQTLERSNPAAAAAWREEHGN